MLLHGYVDGELELMQDLDIESHLKDCSTCAQTHRSIQMLRSAIKKESTYHEPPTELKARIHSAVRGPRRDPRRSHHLGWLAVAASVALIVMGAWGVWRFLLPQADTSVLTEELLASHVRSQMLRAHLVDVESSDRHEVKPWFEGKLDFSPEVTDLASRGFTLIGGRLDYLNRRPVAALVYQRRKHLINVFIWPTGQDPGATAKSALTRQGYHLLSWTKAGMTFWAVSDLNESELGQFVGMMQNQTGLR